MCPVQGPLFGSNQRLETRFYSRLTTFSDTVLLTHWQMAVVQRLFTQTPRAMRIQGACDEDSGLERRAIAECRIYPPVLRRMRLTMGGGTNQRERSRILPVLGLE